MISGGKYKDLPSICYTKEDNSLLFYFFLARQSLKSKDTGQKNMPGVLIKVKKVSP